MYTANIDGNSCLQSNLLPELMNRVRALSTEGFYQAVEETQAQEDHEDPPQPGRDPAEAGRLLLVVDHGGGGSYSSWPSVGIHPGEGRPVATAEASPV